MKVKILLLSSNPSRNLDLGDEHREILKVIKRSDIEIRSSPACRIEDFIEALNEYRPDIVHFTGHGNEEGELLFTDDNGGFKPMPKALLKKLLSVTSDNVKLFFLDACYSEIQASVISSEIDYVIGMNSAINENTATEFATRFYGFFASGASIKESFEQAKITLALKYPEELDTPQLLLRDENVCDVGVVNILDTPLMLNDRLKTNALKEILEKLNISTEELRKWAYSVMPKELNKILSNSVDDIIDTLNSIQDLNNPLNIPILCFAMKVYTQSANNEILNWIEHAKNKYPQLKDCELQCIENTLDTSHNILINISLTDKVSKYATIEVWEDEVLIEEKTNYKPVLTQKIDLKSSKDIQDFLDELYEYLEKFSNWDNILLEFVLLEALLNEKIKLWENSDEFRLPEDFRIVYRLQERFTNYLKYDKFWKSKWEHNHNNRKEKLSQNSLTLLNDNEIKNINSTVSKAVVTKFPICNTKIFKRIYRYGIPLIISPTSSMNADELCQFNEWFEDEFKDTKIEDLIEKVQKLFIDDCDELESNIILILDNPNRLPQALKDPINNQYSI